MRPIGRTVDEKLARIASRAWGVVTRQELLLAGVSDAGIRRRVKKGLLITQYPGVYRVGHAAPSLEADYIAAVKACGEGALLMGRAAAYLQGLLPTRNPPAPEVMCPTQRSIAGIRTKRCRSIHPLDRSTFKGIPITPVPRTLVDLAATIEEDELARAFHEASVRYRTTPSHVKAVLARCPNASGRAGLLRVMTGETPVTLSKLESEFLRLLKKAGLPLPEMNRRVGSHRVDCRWPEHRLTVELDGYRFHNTRHAWEQDRRREREARARGDQHRRYTWDDVSDPGPTLTELRSLLSAAPPP
jgi:hypothetical protein